MKCSVLITVFNCWPLALKAIDSHLKYGNDFIEEIIVIDDCSTENVPAILPDKVRLIRNSVNLGYVKSVNIGFKAAKSPIVLLFDADAIPLVDYGEQIKHVFTTDETIGAIGFRTVDEFDNATGISDPEPNKFSLLFGQKIDHKFLWLWRLVTKRITIYSCAIVLRKTAIESVNGFDENFDFLDADNDFCMRLTRAGWVLKIDPLLKAFHNGGGSPQLTSKRVLRFYINRHRLLVKHNKWDANARFSKLVVLARLQMEYLILKNFGTFLFKDKVANMDKVTGRKKIIDYVRLNY